jgi:phage terminase Nu1 subunit (DNA packaging protein)
VSGLGWRRLWLDAAEQRNAVRRGALVDAEAVAIEWQDIMLKVRAGVMRLPKRAGARLGLSPEQVRALDDEVRAALRELG